MKKSIFSMQPVLAVMSQYIFGEFYCWPQHKSVWCSL